MQKARRIISRARRAGRSSLNSFEAKEVMASYGIRCARGKAVKEADEAPKAARALGGRVAMKVLSPDIIHKTDARCVFLNVGEKDAEKTFRKIVRNAKKRNPKAALDGVLVEEMIPLSTEILVGMKKDPTFGSVIAFGWGGIFVEILKKISFRISPLSAADIDEMVEGLEGIEILRGARGAKPKDLAAVKDIIKKVDRISRENEIREIDLNPVFVYPSGATVVDARVML